MQEQWRIKMPEHSPVIVSASGRWNAVCAAKREMGWLMPATFINIVASVTRVNPKKPGKKPLWK